LSADWVLVLWLLFRDAPPVRVEQVYPTQAACETARSAALPRLPGALPEGQTGILAWSCVERPR
jgi:hypothetical protein